jgi:hypothetical protein
VNVIQNHSYHFPAGMVVAPSPLLSPAPSLLPLGLQFTPNEVYQYSITVANISILDSIDACYKSCQAFNGVFFEGLYPSSHIISVVQSSGS